MSLQRIKRSIRVVATHRCYMLQLLNQEEGTHIAVLNLGITQMMAYNVLRQAIENQSFVGLNPPYESLEQRSYGEAAILFCQEHGCTLQQLFDIVNDGRLH